MKYSNEELMKLSDEEVLRISEKSPDAFGVLVDRYEDAFMRKATSIVYSREDAEEIVQDTFTRIYVYAGKYQQQEGAKFSSWAYTILTRLAYTRYQKLKKKREGESLPEPEAFERIPDTGDFVEELSVQSEVLVALSRLPETFARVLRLQFIEGKTQEEIASLEGASVGAIKTRVHRAKKLFKDALEETSNQ